MTTLDALLKELPAIRQWLNEPTEDVHDSYERAISHIKSLMELTNLLLAERDAARDTTSVYTPPVGVCFTVYHTNDESRSDSHVFEQHKANPNGTPQCGTRYPLQPYAPFIAADLCPRCYPAPAQPTPPQAATTPDAFWDQPLLDDAAQRETRTGAKLTARNNHILRNVKRMYNAHIYKEFSRHANDESLDVALDWLLKAYVVYDRRSEVRANLTTQDDAS